MDGYSELDRSIIKYVDRLRRHGNVDNSRFDRMVDEWRLADDIRNPALDLHGLGAQLTAWIRSGKTDIVTAIRPLPRALRREELAERSSLRTQPNTGAPCRCRNASR
jgi:hypothetical protein